jgi:AcrR family transcriptional regulator
MSSAQPPPPVTTPLPPDTPVAGSTGAGPDTASTDDRTARARIRDAAIACFGDTGVAATTVRQIAEVADVSPALVIHHFGSKEQLRVACDQHVAEVIRSGKSAAMAAGPGLDPLAAVRTSGDVAPIMRYLARTLPDSTPETARLFDEMVADAEAYMAEGVQTGVVQPSAHPRGQATILLAWTLGALVLHEHLERVLGVDLTDGPEAAFTNPDYMVPIMEIYSRGLLTPDAAEQLAGHLGFPDHAGDRT